MRGYLQGKGIYRCRDISVRGDEWITKGESYVGYDCMIRHIQGLPRGCAGRSSFLGSWSVFG